MKPCAVKSSALADAALAEVVSVRTLVLSSEMLQPVAPAEEAE